MSTESFSKFSSYLSMLVTEAAAGRSRNLAEGQQTIRREMAQRGILPTSGAYGSALAKLFQGNLEEGSRDIVSAFAKAHEAFATQLGPDTDEAAIAVAEKALTDQVHATKAGLRHALEQHAGGRAGQLMDPVARALEIHVATLQAGGVNGIRNYIWKFRNIPAATAPTTSNITNIGAMHGGLVQTGSAAHAHVSTTTINNGADPASLIAALAQFQKVIGTARIEEDAREELGAHIEVVKSELTKPNPNRSRLRAAFGALGAVVSFLPDLKPAWDSVDWIWTAVRDQIGN